MLYRKLSPRNKSVQKLSLLLQITQLDEKYFTTSFLDEKRIIIFSFKLQYDSFVTKFSAFKIHILALKTCVLVSNESLVRF